MVELNAATIAGGGLVERLNEEIHKAVANCLDINTPSDKTRTVTLKVKIKPDKTRCVAGVTVETSSTLCPPEAISTTIMMETNVATGEITASEMGSVENPAQVILPEVEGKMGTKITRFAEK